jgi:flagellar biosynthesis protein FlhG
MNGSVASLVANLSGRSGDAPRRSYPGVMVVGSGKGGIGTSTAACLLALAGARSGHEVLLVDGNEGPGTLHLILGFPVEGPGLGALRGGDVVPEELVVRVQPRLSLLPGGGGEVEATYTAGLGEHRALFGRVSGLYDQYGMVVVDGGSHLHSVVAACSHGTGRLLAVTSGDRISMAAGYALLKTSKHRFPDLPVQILVNGHDERGAGVVWEAISTACRRFLGVSAEYAGYLPEDPALRTSLRAGIPIQEVGSDSTARVAAEAIVAGLLPPSGSEPVGAGAGLGNGVGAEGARAPTRKIPPGRTRNILPQPHWGKGFKTERPTSL